MKKVDLIKLLLAIGVSQVNAEKIAANTPDDGSSVLDEVATASIVSDFKAAQLELAKNNPDIVKPIQDSERAKQLDIVERKIKQTFGLNPEDVKDKKIEDIITLAKSKAGSTTDKSVKDLEDELMAAKASIKKYDEETIPMIRKEVESHKNEFDYEQMIVQSVSKHELRNPINAVLPSVKNSIKENFDIKRDEKGVYTLYQKGTDLRAKTADGNGFLELNEFLKEQMTKDGFLKQSNANDPTGNQAPANGKTIATITKEEPEGQKNMLHLAAAQAHAESLKAATKK